CWVDGNIDLDSAQASGVVAILGSRVGGVSANFFRGKLPLMLHDSEFSRDVQLAGAKIEGILDLDGVTLHSILDADSLQVEGHLLMRSTDKNTPDFKGAVLLYGASIQGNLKIEGAVFEDDFNADSLDVGRHLLMVSTDKVRTRFKKVLLGGAKVAGDFMI